jgi:hypothetical protein
LGTSLTNIANKVFTFQISEHDVTRDQVGMALNDPDQNWDVIVDEDPDFMVLGSGADDGERVRRHKTIQLSQMLHLA